MGSRKGWYPARRALAAMIAVAMLGGCAGYHSKVGGSVEAVQNGAVDVALEELDRKHTDKDLLYFLERGELLRMKGSYADSRDTWLRADEFVRKWEDEARTNPDKLLGEIGSFLVNDTTRRYDGRDYEKVMVSVRLALDHLALGDWGNARTEIKKMHEREAIIAEFRAKEVEAARASAEEKGLKVTSFKELNGYPVETLDDPEVRSLKNAYESAFANYLAGFVYEAQGEPSLAAAGYRKAIEMRPGIAMLEESLKELDSRAHRARATGVDTLIVVETGTSPAITSRNLPIPLPIPSRGGVQIVMTPLSWPVLNPVSYTAPPSSVSVGGQTASLSMITNVDHMARRALADEMPGIIARSSIRAIAKGAAQKAVQDSASGVAGALLGIAAGVAAVASEQADERSWRTLPANFSVGRVMLPPGEHKLSVQTAAGTITRDVKLSGSHAVVTLRATGNAVYLAQTPYVEGASVGSAEPPAPEPAAQPAPPPKPAKNTPKKRATSKPDAAKPDAVKAESTNPVQKGAQ